MTKTEQRRAWRVKRTAQGLCLQCSNKADGKRLCRDCVIKARPYLLKSHKKHKARVLRWARNKSARDKVTVFEHYGNKCSCCGESCAEFLTIDHIRRDGAKDPRCHYPGKPKNYRITGGRWYVVIIRLGFPDDLRLMCWNCNHAEHIYGTCPHQKQLRLL